MSVTRDLIRSRGYSDVTFNMISRQAGVARQSLHRRWRSKAELVIDAFLATLSSPDSMTLQPMDKALRQHFDALAEALAADPVGFRKLFVEAQRDSDLLEAFRSRFLQPRAGILARILDFAARRGDIARDTNLPLLVDIVQSLVWSRISLCQPIDPKAVDQLIGLIRNGPRQQGALAAPLVSAPLVSAPMADAPGVRARAA